MVNDFKGLTEALDRILTIHFANADHTPNKIKLYDAARAKTKEPLTYAFARAKSVRGPTYIYAILNDPRINY